MSKIRVATTWLDGCSGCHMSFLDMDERLVDIADKIDIVYGPLVDAKDIPDDIDVVLIEGAVSSAADTKMVQRLRERSRLLVSFGDCAVTANVPAMRNRFSPAQVLERAYIENATLNAQKPCEGIPPLLDQARPLHEFVDVDVFLPGCPPPVEAIVYMLQELLEGRTPDLGEKSRFGA